MNELKITKDKMRLKGHVHCVIWVIAQADVRPQSEYVKGGKVMKRLSF